MFWEIKKKTKQQKKKLIAKNMKKYLHNRNGQYYIANKCHQFSNLEVIYIAEYTKVIHWLKIEQNLQEPDWPFVSFWNLKSLFCTCSYLFSLAEPDVCCHLLSHRCHLLSLVVPLVFTRCHSIHHSSVFLWTIFQCCDVSAFHRCLLSRLRKDFPLNFLKVFQLFPLFLSYF